MGLSEQYCPDCSDWSYCKKCKPKAREQVAIRDVPFGARFIIPDLQGGHARCCGPTENSQWEPAIYKMERIEPEDPARLQPFNRQMRCVRCDKTTPLHDTLVQVAEVI